VSAVTGTTDIDPCPYCGASIGVQRVPAPAKVQAWACDHCHTNWAVSVVNPHLRGTAYLTDLAAAVGEISRLRWTLAQVITLADDAPQLADWELRTRLVALASDAR
jgi:ribosomal protein L37AE/L43A